MNAVAFFSTAAWHGTVYDADCPQIDQFSSATKQDKGQVRRGIDIADQLVS